TDVVNFAGSLLTAKNAGIGASAGFTFVSRDTEAFVSDLDSVASPVDAFLVDLATQFSTAVGAFCGSDFPLSLLDQLGLTAGAGRAPTPAVGSKVDSRGSVLVSAHNGGFVGTAALAGAQQPASQTTNQTGTTGTGTTDTTQKQ